MKKLVCELLSIVIVVLSLMLSGCANSEKRLDFTCDAERESVAGGEKVSITVSVVNLGRKFKIIGPIGDKFSQAELVMISGEAEYVFKSEYSGAITTDATEYSFKNGERKSHEYAFIVPDDAVPGVYDLTFSF